MTERRPPGSPSRMIVTIACRKSVKMSRMLRIVSNLIRSRTQGACGIRLRHGLTGDVFGGHAEETQVKLGAGCKRVKHGRFVLLPITDQTRGHGTHSIPAIWKNYLAELLQESTKTH